jgi:hypothetical protein
VLTRDKIHICPVTVQSRIQKLLQLLQFQMSKFRLDPQYVATFSQPLLESTQAHLKSLYQELIAPIRHLLEARHVVFVQHGCCTTFRFMRCTTVRRTLSINFRFPTLRAPAFMPTARRNLSMWLGIL